MDTQHRFTDTENKLVVTSGERLGGEGREEGGGRENTREGKTDRKEKRALLQKHILNRLVVMAILPR